MNGWLVINGYLKGEKYDQIYQMLITAFEKFGVTLNKIKNCDLLVKTDISKISPKPDFVLFWDKDIKLASYLERLGLRVYNSSSNIAICDDKGRTALELFDKGIRLPQTILAPTTFGNIGYTDYGFVDEAIDILGLPMVIKECFGSFGHGVFLAHTKEDAMAIVKRIGTKPMLFQKLMASSFGRDIRVQTAGRKIVASVTRVAKEGEFVANVTSGGRMYPYTLSKSEEKIVYDTIDVLKLDFAGIDLLFGEDGNPYLCEINTNAHFKNLFDATGVNAAEAIAEYIIND